MRALLDGIIGGLARPLWRLLGFVLSTDKLLALVETTGIVIFVGPNGSGKSLSAVMCSLATLDGIGWECIDPNHVHNEAFRLHADDCPSCTPSLWRFFTLTKLADVRPHLCDLGHGLLQASHTGERLVYSTVVLLGDDGREHVRYRPLQDYRELLRIEHADVLFDEVAGVSDASDSASMPVQVVNWLHQLRKRDVRLRVTTPAYGRCSKPIRQVAQVVIDCRSFVPEVRESGRLWRPRRGFLFVAYDAFAFEDFTSSTARAADKQGRGERKTRMARGAFWRPGSRAEGTYNTLGQVLALGHVTESGMCMVCGGARSRPRCGCPDLPEDAVVEVEETVSSSGARVRRGVPIRPVRLTSVD